MYSEDLSPLKRGTDIKYWYDFADDCEFEKLLTIGWLDCNHSFPVGTIDNALIKKLRDLICCIPKGINVHVARIRGQHPCNLCKAYPKIRCKIGGMRHLGCTELRIPSREQKIVFASPDMILHYIEEHSYLPPAEFLEALRNFDTSQPFDAEELGKKLIEHRE
ncbi:hypothetical protein [uncultured Gimesia sp.]|uniref:DUF7919 family protein n=1 Tax=uncultured Gimesia sp. TaxID=1678688 RepID=UPI0030DADFAD|tara:strand:+ start:8060 stop:8548 length:489 start_codon:yes stop_codon:yes gene_type:complete